MTTTNMSVAELLKIGEEDFDKAIKEMNMKNLMEMISGLQKEMAREQESFNSLSAEIQNFKERNSRQYKQISKDMMASQQRLTLLMNRSMKCFAQQNAHQSSNGSPLKRRNSAKGPQPVVTSSTKSSFIQRSRSLHAVNQLSDSESPSSEQPPAKPQAATETKPHYSMNKSHTPIIMKTGVNGNNNNNKVTRVTTTNNINFEPKNWSGPRSNVSSSLSSLVSTGTGNIKSGGGKESSSVNLSMEPGSVKRHEKNTTDGDGSKDTQSLNAASGSDSVSGGGGGGLYVKRRPAQQQQRVTTTTNISSSRFLPKSEPPPSSPPPTTASSSSSSAAALPPRPPASTSSSSFAKETRFLKSKPPVPPAAQVVSQSPLQMAQARKGLSKSQIITQDPASNSSSGFRGLPNVRLLAQSFGSSTALNVTPAPSTNNPSLSGNQTNTSPSRVVRSNSSAGLSSPTTASPSNRIFLNKGSAAGALQQISQEQPVFINGRPQQLEAKPQNKVAQSTAPNASGPSELEQARARLRTNRNKWETTPEASDVNGNAQVITPDCSPASQQTLKSSEEEAKEQRITENLRVGGYVKKKDAAPAKPPGTVLPPSSPSVTIRSINSSTRAPTNTNNIGAPPPVTIVQHNQPSSSSISSVQSSQAASSSKTTSAPQPAVVTAKPPAATQNQTASSSHFISSFPKQQTQTSSTLGNVSKLSMSFASFEPKPSSTSGRIISTTAANIRRTKSREELQEIENQTRSNKDSLLKQIQARRRDDDDTTGGSNIKSMSKLSFSMPSLLLDGKDIFLYFSSSVLSPCFLAGDFIAGI